MHACLCGSDAYGIEHSVGGDAQSRVAVFDFHGLQSTNLEQSEPLKFTDRILWPPCGVPPGSVGGLLDFEDVLLDSAPKCAFRFQVRIPERPDKSWCDGRVRDGHRVAEQIGSCCGFSGISG